MPLTCILPKFISTEFEVSHDLFDLRESGRLGRCGMGALVRAGGVSSASLRNDSKSKLSSDGSSNGCMNGCAQAGLGAGGVDGKACLNGTGSIGPLSSSKIETSS